MDMDIQTIVSAISSVGFPIAACIGIFYLYDKTIKDITNTLNTVNNTLQKIDRKLDNDVSNT